MEKNTLQLCEISQKGIEKLLKNWFNDYIKLTDIKEISSKVFSLFKKDIDFTASVVATQMPVVKSKSMLALMCYRLANYLFYSNHIKQDKKKYIHKFTDAVAVETTINIHPAAKIDEQFFISGNNIIIGETCKIGSKCKIHSNVILGSVNASKNEKKQHPTLKNNVTINNNARVLGNIQVGENCTIASFCVVLDDVPDNTQVVIVNQLQISTGVNSLPSQKAVVYGIVPKFKNTFIIYGEGFYNPTVLLKLKDDKQLVYQIDYWDKNKIIIKFKTSAPLTQEQAQKVKVIVLSNADKVIITQSFGLIKALTTLTV